ncbi:MAG TPA: 23S rRNA (adenine(2503)-C(2))-methyltransferase RlmN [Phycisphaerae bacterium]|nr:23S rRNA (adenine(2503)-C(2))-methyltransferase RlmN [Phycisphaerae bacterium]
MEQGVNVVGMTFDEVVAAVSPRPAMVRPLRDAYKQLMRGQAEEVSLPWSNAVLRADVYPVVRHQRDGELIKFVQGTADGLEIESVIVPMRRAGRKWQSLCVSSQIGCARGCAFCETARLGFLRQLSAGEIVGQIVAARREFQAEIRNVVFMGMGEPFDNFEAVVQAVRVLSDRSGPSIGKSRICISTAGRAEGIRRLAALGWRRLNLAVSLNAPNDQIRSRIMPMNRSESMAVLREALLAYPLRTCQFFMIEYVLISGVNDAREHARQLAEYLKPVKCCVNVIPYNPRPDSALAAPTEEEQRQFLAWLQEAGQFCKPRLTKGREHMAACGQLGNRMLARRPAAARG